MAIEFQELPYAYDALQPFLSEETLKTHYGKHHRGYVDKLNSAISGTRYEDMPLEQIIRESKDSDDSGVFNNAAQVFNHEFLWQSMSPDGGGSPQAALEVAIVSSFGSVEAFNKAFRDAALSQFGSGWVWLVSDAGKLRIVTTGNAGTPITSDLVPLLTLDVWEHAYYLDFKNDRAGYVDQYLDSHINWAFADRNLETIAEAA